MQSSQKIQEYLSGLFDQQITLNNPIQLVFKPGPFYSDGASEIHLLGLAYENGDEPANDYVIIMPAGFSSDAVPGEWGQIEKTVISSDGNVKLITTSLDGLRLHIVAYQYDGPNKPDKKAFSKHVYSILNDTIQAGFEYDVLMHSDRGFGEFFDRTFPNTLCPADWKPKYYLKGSTISYDAPRKWVLKQEFPIERVKNEKAQAILYKLKN